MQCENRPLQGLYSLRILGESVAGVPRQLGTEESILTGSVQSLCLGESPAALGRYPLPRPGHRLAPAMCSLRTPLRFVRSAVRFSLHDASRHASLACKTVLVPGGRIELPWIAPHDFESCASTNSAIPAFHIVYKNRAQNQLIKNPSLVLTGRRPGARYGACGHRTARATGAFRSGARLASRRRSRGFSTKCLNMVAPVLAVRGEGVAGRVILTVCFFDS